MKNITPLGLFIVWVAFIGCDSTTSTEESAADQLSRDFSPEQKELIEKIRQTDILEWTPDMQLLGYQNTHEVSPVRYLKPSDNPYPLPESEEPIKNLQYGYNGQQRELDFYLDSMRVAGLLVIHEGEIILETYGDEHDEVTTWNSFSVTKSVLSMMFGAAIADDYIRGVEDYVTRYLPELRGSAYEDVTLEHLLWMGSGVAWNEDYTDPQSDVATLDLIEDTDEFIAYMADLERAHEPGSTFNYSTGEVNLAGVVLQEAVGSTLTEYANERIWQGFGMEHPASWSLIGEEATEHGGCCISATLRDYGRMGMMAKKRGENHQDESLLPESWMERSVTPSAVNEEYGYLWWLQDEGVFNGSGIFGQYLYINQEEKLIIAMQSKWKEATGPEYTDHRASFIEGIRNEVLK